MCKYLTMIVLLLSLAPQLHAQGKAKLAKQSIEFAARKIGSKTTPKLGKHAVKKAAVRSIATITADDAAVVITKHSTLAKPLVKQYGETATQAFSRLSNRNARRLAMLADDGPPPNKELLSVIAQHGDPAMNFIWKNKGALLTASALAAFVANPEPFINGLNPLSTDAAADALEQVATGVATRTNWTLLIPVVLCILVATSVIRRRFA